MAATYAEGKYRARILQQGFERSSVKKTPCFFLQIEIQSAYGEGQQLEDCPRFERTYRQYLANETGVNILRSDLKALDVEFSDFRQLDPDAPDGVCLVGREIDVECRHEPFDGTISERWCISRPLKKSDPEALLSLNDRFGHLLRGGNGKAAPAAPVKSPNNSDAAF